MKGVKKGDEKKVLERRAWVEELFRRDCRERMGRGFVDPPLSPGKCNDAYKKKFNTTMNSQKVYKLRERIFKEFGLDKYGVPERGGAQQVLPGIPRLQPATSMPALHRDPDDPLFHVALIKTTDETYGAFLQDALRLLQQKGMVADTVKVDAINRHYVSVSSFPEEGTAPAPAPAPA